MERKISEKCIEKRDYYGMVCDIVPHSAPQYSPFGQKSRSVAELRDNFVKFK